jgi:hypothetical protein
MVEFIQLHGYRWKEISKQPSLPLEVIRRYADRLDWESVCEYRPLSIMEVIEFEPYIDWKSLCRYQPVGEALIERYYRTLPWSIMVTRQNLSMLILEKFWHAIEPYTEQVVKYQVMDTDWMKEKGLVYPYSRMDIWPAERKWRRCEQFGYDGDRGAQVVYAYKSTQKDGYSILNRKVRYELGEWSEDWHCDGNLDHPYSFGLSAGHKNAALHFYPKGSLFKVGIPIKALYCVTDEGVIRTKSMLPLSQIK